MKAWVFDEQMLDAALERWLSNTLGEGDEPGIKQVRNDIRDFLHSPEAAKLRVGSLERSSVIVDHGPQARDRTCGQA